MKSTVENQASNLESEPGRVAVAVLVALAGAGLLAFLGLTKEVTAGEIEASDETVFFAFRSATNMTDPLGPAWLEEAEAEITALGGYPVLGLIALTVIGGFPDARDGPVHGHGAAAL